MASRLLSHAVRSAARPSARTASTSAGAASSEVRHRAIVRSSTDLGQSIFTSRAAATSLGLLSAGTLAWCVGSLLAERPWLSIIAMDRLASLGSTELRSRAGMCRSTARR